MLQRLEVPYCPREQFLDFHDRTQRYAVIVAHRRAGKTVACVNDLIKRAITDGKENARYAYLAPFYTQAKDIAWEYLKQYSEPIWGDKPNESELKVSLLNGATIRLYGADNYHRMRGIFLDGIVLDEPAQMRPGVYDEVIRPALSDRQGWAVWIGTPMGHNHFYDLWAKAEKEPDAWYSVMLRASETNILPKGELLDAKKRMTPASYEQEFECSFEAAIKGAFFGEEISKATKDGRVKSVPHDDELSVETWFDLGLNDPTAIWFVQHSLNEIHIIDYHEQSGMTPKDIVEFLDQKKKERGFIYHRHVWPHDGGYKLQATGGKTMAQIAYSLGLETEVQPKLDVQHSIDETKMAISRCYFDADRCEQGLEALKNYRQEFDEDKRAFKPKPLHDWASHGADAFRLGICSRGESDVKRKMMRDYSEDRARKARSAWAA